MWDFPSTLSLCSFLCKLVFLVNFCREVGGERLSFCCLCLAVKTVVACALGFPGPVSNPLNLYFVPVVQVLLRFTVHAASPPQCGVISQFGAPASHSLGVTGGLCSSSPCSQCGLQRQGRANKALAPTQAECYQLLSLQHPRGRGGQAHLPHLSGDHLSSPAHPAQTLGGLAPPTWILGFPNFAVNVAQAF